MNIQEPLVSIIVPVYNVEPYLDKCVQSILKQSYKNLEIILVDDGSTDASGTMCEEYAQMDLRVKVIHKVNGGLSSARNMGLEVMSGFFFTFVDSDDYIHSECIKRLYSYMLQDKTDLCVCEPRRFKFTPSETSSVLATSRHYIYDKESARRNTLARKIPMYACGKLFTANLKEHIRFPEGKLYEDMPVIWHVIKHIKCMTYVQEGLYYYRQRSGSILHSPYNHNRMEQLYNAERILSEFSKQDPLHKTAASLCFFCAADNYVLVAKEYQEDIIYLKKAIIEYRKYVIDDSNAKMSLKVMAALSYICLYMVRIIGRIYKSLTCVLQ